MMLLINLLEAAPAAKAGAQQGSPWSFWIMIVAIFVIMYFFMIRPQKKKQKQIEQFRKSLGVGNHVVTAGGIHGIIRKVNEADNSIVLEIAKNVEITIEKSSIYANASAAAESQAK